MLKIKISYKFLPIILFKKFSDKILLDNNLTHPLKNKFSKNVYNSKQITFSKVSSSSFSDYSRVLPYLNFSIRFLSILKNSRVNLLGNVCHMLRLNKSENVIKKYKYTEKRVYRALKRRLT